MAEERILLSDTTTSAHSTKHKKTTNNFLPPLEILEAELKENGWEAVAWKHAIALKTLEAKVKTLGRKDVPKLPLGLPVQNLEFIQKLRDLGFSYRFLVLFHQSPIHACDVFSALEQRTGDEASSWQKVSTVAAAALQKDSDFGKAAAISGETRDAWLSHDEVRLIVDMCGEERLARVLLQQTGGFTSKAGSLDQWRKFVRASVNGEPWTNDHQCKDDHLKESSTAAAVSSWCPCSKKRRASAAASADTTTTTIIAQEHQLRTTEATSSTCSVVIDHDDFCYMESYMPSSKTILQKFQASDKCLARLAWSLAIPPRALRNLMQMQWPLDDGALHYVDEEKNAHSLELIRLFSDFGFSAELITIVCSEPTSAGAILEATRGKTHLTRCTGLSLGVHAQQRDVTSPWFTQSQIQHMVALTSPRRVAALLFNQTVQTEPELYYNQKLWILWKQFVESECKQSGPWIGVEFGWNPSLLSQDDLITCYVNLVDQYHDMHPQTSRRRQSLAKSFCCGGSLGASACPPPTIISSTGGGASNRDDNHHSLSPVTTKRQRGSHQWDRAISHKSEIVYAEVTSFLPTIVLPEAHDEESWEAVLANGREAVVTVECIRCGVSSRRKLRLLRAGSCAICKCTYRWNSSTIEDTLDAELPSFTVQSLDSVPDIPPTPNKKDATCGAKLIPRLHGIDAKKVRSRLHKKYLIVGFDWKYEAEWALPQYRLYAKTTCQCCNAESITPVRTIRDHSPVCICNGKVINETS